MKIRNKLRRILALLITIALILGSVSVSAFAGSGDDCSHIHDESCGYIKASPCLDHHEHNENCFDENEELDCTYTHTHDADCGWAEAISCSHICSCNYGEPSSEPSGEPADEPTDEPSGEPADEPSGELPGELTAEGQPDSDSVQVGNADNADDFVSIDGMAQGLTTMSISPLPAINMPVQTATIGYSTHSHAVHLNFQELALDWAFGTGQKYRADFTGSHPWAFTVGGANPHVVWGQDLPSYTIRPASGLTPGTYTATLRIRMYHTPIALFSMLAMEFRFTFVVEPPIATFVRMDGQTPFWQERAQPRIHFEQGVGIPIYAVKVPNTPEVDGTNFSHWNVNPINCSVTGEDYFIVNWCFDFIAYYDVDLAVNQVRWVDHDDTVLFQEYVQNARYSFFPPDLVPDREGHTFRGWDNSDVRWTSTFLGGAYFIENVTSAITIRAQYERIIPDYQVTFVGWDGTVLRSIMIGEGESAVLEGIFPVGRLDREGHTFIDWERNGVFEPPTSRSNITSDTIFIARYRANTYAVTVDGGDIVGRTSPVEFDTIVHIQAIPPDGQQFVRWETTSPGVNFADANQASTNFTMPNNAVTVTAVFEPLPARHHSITITNTGGGDANANAQSATQGTVITLMAVPGSGNRFVRWEVVSGMTASDLSDTTANPATLTMPDNAVSIRAVFEPIPVTNHDITVIHMGGGDTSVYVQSATQGSQIILMAVPGTGNRFVRWEVMSGGVTLSSTMASQTTFIMPDNAVTIIAHFEPIPDTGGDTDGGNTGVDTDGGNTGGGNTGGGNTGGGNTGGGNTGGGNTGGGNIGGGNTGGGTVQPTDNTTIIISTGVTENTENTPSSGNESVPANPNEDPVVDMQDNEAPQTALIQDEQTPLAGVMVENRTGFPCLCSLCFALLVIAAIGSVIAALGAIVIIIILLKRKEDKGTVHLS